MMPSSPPTSSTGGVWLDDQSADRLGDCLLRV
jgi:hypothetical protein